MHPSMLVMHYWFVDWLIYVGFSYMIISFSPFTLVLFMPDSPLVSNTCIPFQQCIVTWIVVMINFPWPTQQGWLSTHATDRPLTGIMLSLQEKENKETKLKWKMCGGTNWKNDNVRKGWREVMKVHKMILKEQWLEMRRWNEKVGRKLAWRPQY